MDVRRTQTACAAARWGAALALALAAAATPALAQDEEIRCPEFPTPNAGRLEWVAPNLRYSGIPMQIKELVTPEPPERVLAFYRNRWSDAPPFFHEYEVGDWKAIATMRARCFYTVQVKADGKGARALLGVSRRPDVPSARQPGAGFPMLSGSRVVNDIDHYDAGKTARTLLIMNNFPPETNAAYYRRTLKADGWVAIADRAVPGAKGLSHVMVLKYGHHETNLTISPGPLGSTILVTQVDRP